MVNALAYMQADLDILQVRKAASKKRGSQKEDKNSHDCDADGKKAKGEPLEAAQHRQE